jgi:hypothetical protein
MHLQALSTYGSIRFRGDTLDIDAVSTVLSVEPRIAYRKGEIWKTTRTGHEVRGRTNLWLYDSRDIESHILHDHVLHLSAILSGRRSSLASTFVSRLGGLLVPGVLFDVALFWRGRVGTCLPSVDSSIRALVEAYGGTIETDFDTEDEDDGAA